MGVGLLYANSGKSLDFALSFDNLIALINYF